MPKFTLSASEISDKYYDDKYVYRHVNLCQRDYERLPAEYLRFYEPRNEERLRIEREYDEKIGHISTSTNAAALLEALPPMKQRLLAESEWRVAFQLSKGYEHYLVFPADSNVILLRKPIELD